MRTTAFDDVDHNVVTVGEGDHHKGEASGMSAV